MIGFSSKIPMCDRATLRAGRHSRRLKEALPLAISVQLVAIKTTIYGEDIA
jgi:hypothetical protein